MLQRFSSLNSQATQPAFSPWAREAPATRGPNLLLAEQIVCNVHNPVHGHQAPDAGAVGIRQQRQDQDSFYKELPVLRLRDSV